MSLRILKWEARVTKTKKDLEINEGNNEQENDNENENDEEENEEDPLPDGDLEDQEIEPQPALTSIELKFAMLWERLSADKMEILAWDIHWQPADSNSKLNSPTLSLASLHPSAT